MNGRVVGKYRALRIAAWLCAAGLGASTQAGLSPAFTLPGGHDAGRPATPSCDSTLPFVVSVDDISSTAFDPIAVAQPFGLIYPAGLDLQFLRAGACGPGPEPVVIQLPPPPDSARIALSGLLTIGVWSVLRSARGMHLGTIADWYHASAPAQVGHAVAFEPGGQVLLACWTHGPHHDLRPQPTLRVNARAPVARCVSQFSTLATAARGPPPRT